MKNTALLSAQLIYLFAILGHFIIGLTLLLIKTSPLLTDKSYHRAKSLLGIASLLLSIGYLTQMQPDLTRRQIDLFCFINLIAASLQAWIFTFAALILLHSPYVRLRNILLHLAPTVVIVLLYMVVTSFVPDLEIFSFNEYTLNPPLLLRTAFAALFGCQLAIYFMLFRRQREQYIGLMNDYFGNVSSREQHWVSRRFYQACGIGVAVLFFVIFPSELPYPLITLTIVVYYYIFGIGFINYQYDLIRVVPAVEIDNEGARSEQKEPLTLSPITPQEIESRIKSLLLRDRFYSRPSISVAEVALLLDISPRMLSAHIKGQDYNNFNRWINNQRILWSKRLISKNQNIPLSEIAVCVGFSDLSQFSREFKRQTGITPSFYRDNNRLNSPGSEVVLSRKNSSPFQTNK